MSHKTYSGFYLPERYISKARPEQIAAQIIQVYSFEEVSWRTLHDNKQYLVPAGKKNEILSVDLGAVLPGILDIVNAERCKLRKKNKMEENLKGSRKFRLPDSLRYLDSYIISEFKVQEDALSYSFNLHPESITLQRPLEFRIIEYLAENKEFIAVSSEKIFVWAERWENSNIPTNNCGLWYVPGAFNMISDKEVIKRVS